MMKNSLYLITALLILIGCTREEPEPEVTFTLNVSGFNITSDDFGTLKSTQAGIFDSFEHKYSGGELHFTAPSGAVYIFDTKSISIDGFTLTLPAGTYQLSGFGGIASYAGAEGMAFIIPEQEAAIIANTTSLDVIITPDCGLILVADQSSQVESAGIKPESSSLDWPFFEDGIFHYTYFEPKAQHLAYINKFDGTSLNMLTNLLKKGYVYKIEVTEGGSGMGLNLNPTFVDAEIVVW